jgi:hypothetical protein
LINSASLEMSRLRRRVGLAEKARGTAK